MCVRVCAGWPEHFPIAPPQNSAPYCPSQTEVGCRAESGESCRGFPLQPHHDVRWRLHSRSEAAHAALRVGGTSVRPLVSSLGWMTCSWSIHSVRRAPAFISRSRGALIFTSLYFFTSHSHEAAVFDQLFKRLSFPENVLTLFLFYY